nr:MAG TPA: hypothetical protein [Caudoviricetes sp.]
MKLTITKSEGAIIQKLIADRKSDIHNLEVTANRQSV